jgi:alpha-beta hydrolase superfamily lysophospholipase
MKSRTRRLFRIAFAGLAGLLLLWAVVSFLVAFRLTRRPRPVFAEPVPTISWGCVEDYRLATADGEEVGAWYVPGPEAGPSVVLLHGVDGCRSYSLSRGELLARQGCTVLLLSLRAHGDSTGTRNDFGYSARHDVVAAVEFLERRRPGRPILLAGVSMGAAAAAFAAADLGERLQGCLLEQPYQDLRTAVRNRTDHYLPPLLDRLAYTGLLMAAPAVLPEVDEIAPARVVAAIPTSVPVWILAGQQDRKARPEEAEALFAQLTGPRRLEFFPQAGHESLCCKDPERFALIVREWLEAVRRQEPNPARDDGP